MKERAPSETAINCAMIRARHTCFLMPQATGLASACSIYAITSDFLDRRVLDRSLSLRLFAART
jgi:hypothetical protein